jgi:hypothetical protein
VLLRCGIPEGLNALHHCDNPICVNPDHIFLGTQSDNMRDCSKKGRMACDRSKALLTLEQVIEIRSRPITKKRGYIVALAKEFQVPKTSIKGVLYHETWKNV